MNIDGIPTRSLRAHPEQRVIAIIDQTRLPHALHWERVATLEAAAHAIRAMQVRGAPLIGATAAYGLALALDFEASDRRLAEADALLRSTRPTAVNLHWALARMEAALAPLPPEARCAAAWVEAAAIADEDVAQNTAIGAHGLALWHEQIVPSGDTLNVMTHCNAGWLATVAHGTALAPVYAARAAGDDVFVWVSETRPRNQGLLTAWELRHANIPHALIADNAAGLLIMRGEVDLVIVGADRIAGNGDVANKVGTYLKALAANVHGVPFYVAAPLSTIDFDCPEGAAIPIEERDAAELGEKVSRGDTPVVNPAFDITPADLITGIITEQGILPPTGLAALRR